MCVCVRVCVLRRERRGLEAALQILNPGQPNFHGLDIAHAVFLMEHFCVYLILLTTKLSFNSVSIIFYTPSTL